MSAKNLLVHFIAGCFYLTLSSTAYSQEFTEDAIKNFGSGAAALMQCEMNGYIPIGTTPDYLKAIRKNAPEYSGKMIMNQYQKSLHEKKIYSIAKKQWYKFNPNQSDCTDMYKAYPSLLYHFNNLNN